MGCLRPESDRLLEPFLVRFTAMRHGYVIELRYLKRSAFATEERVAAAARATQAQLRRYLAGERLAQQYHRCASPAWRSCSTAGKLVHSDAITRQPTWIRTLRASLPFLTARSIPARGQRPRRSTRRSFRPSYASMVRDSRYKLLTGRGTLQTANY